MKIQLNKRKLAVRFCYAKPVLMNEEDLIAKSKLPQNIKYKILMMADMLTVIKEASNDVLVFEKSLYSLFVKLNLFSALDIEADMVNEEDPIWRLGVQIVKCYTERNKQLIIDLFSKINSVEIDGKQCYEYNI